MSHLVQIYIEAYLKEQTAVGIVSFQSYATVLAPMTVIASSAERGSLASKVPTIADGGTSIIAGLEQCQGVRIKYLLYFYLVSLNDDLLAQRRTQTAIDIIIVAFLPLVDIETC